MTSKSHDITAADAAHDDEFEQLRAEVQNDPAARAVYEDTITRASLLAAGPQLRRRRKLSQTDVAMAMRTTQSAVSDLESGRVEPQLGTLQRYARAIGQRLDISIVAGELPVFEQGAATELWSQLEQSMFSPLLTVLATSTEDRGRRTLAALARSVLLPPPMVDPLLATLLERGWASSTGSGDQKVYSLIDRAAYVVGVSLGKDCVAGVVMDLNGEVIDDSYVTLADTSRSSVVKTALEVVGGLFDANHSLRIIGVGVTLAGIVDATSGCVQFAPDLQTHEDSWEGFDLQAALEQSIRRKVNAPNLLVVVENDANALAIREYLRRGDQSVVTLLLSGSGIGAGLVFDGHVARGAHSAAGEGGHLVLDPAGPACRAGLPHKGCLETMTSAHAILESLDIGACDPRQIDEGLVAVNDRIRNGDAEATQVVVKAGEALGRFLASSIVLIDPARAVIYAHRQLARSHDYVSAQVFQRGVTAGLGATVSVRGKASESPRLEWHPLEELTGAKAAGAAALRRFLDEPTRWAPSMLNLAALEQKVTA